MLLRYTLMLVIVGLFIGLFHEYDQMVAVGLGAGLLVMMYRKRSLPTPERRVFVSGMLLSAGLGMACEYWGVSNRYWTYHDLDTGQSLPAWLPFAWAGAFAFLYSVERNLERRLEGSPKLRRFSSRLLLTAAISAVFPTLGEIITIQLGVWTYAWGYQFFGVPVLAILLLATFHTGIFLVLRRKTFLRG